MHPKKLVQNNDVFLGKMVGLNYSKGCAIILGRKPNPNGQILDSRSNGKTK
jgi:hypothetical protein